MTRSGPVLLGSRSAPRSRGAFAAAVFTWLPVAIMLAVIARESTATFGAVNTARWLRPVYEALAGPISDERWMVVHHYIRKTGHFIGYGTLGLTWLRAFLLTWMQPMRHRSAAVWRRWSLQMAICCTALVASLDEVHQSYLPDRTGLVTDVLLDTTGALAFCLIAALFWTRKSVRHAQYEA